MNRLLGLIALLVVFATSVGAYVINYDNEENKKKVLIDILMNRLSELHYSPKDVDDSLAQTVFDEFVKRMDYGKRFFLKEDIEAFQPYREKIDDLVKEKNYEFFDLTLEHYNKRLTEAKSYYEELIETDFDFSKDEYIERDYDKVAYLETKTELKDYWRKTLKYDIMSRLVDKLDAQEKAQEENDTTVTVKTFEELAIDAKEKVKKNYDNWFKRLDKKTNKDYLATYINSIVNTYDTHTGYFPPKDKADFDIRLSGKLEGIGATLSEKDGYIEVKSIVPGSPCYLQGDLEVDDLILKVAQGADEPVDVVDMPLSDAVQLIRGKKGTEVRLTVKKTDGSQKVVPIIRDVVLLEETYAKSAFLQENGKKVGYIKLPKFYADFKNPKGRQCARDVEVELEKLKAEGADGVILDLRSNGGGSLQDVVKMAGHFIDEGPVVQIKARKGMPYVLKDEVPGTVFDEPLVILVNSFSASASEILAAAIQDYGRGIVIGSNSTYGKGTVQRFYDLDQYIKDDFSELKPIGAVKMTTQKFYRINGESTQHIGVVPDIVLPDTYSYIETGEKEQDYAMPWDEINPVQYDETQMDWNLNKLIKSSESRVNLNETFNKIKKDAERRKRNRDLTKYNLQLDTFQSERCQRKEEAEKYKKLQDKALDFEVTLLEADEMAMVEDTVKQKTSNDWLEKLSKDVYLEEAMNVIGDMIKAN